MISLSMQVNKAHVMQNMHVVGDWEKRHDKEMLWKLKKMHRK
jgi:hypothetical protein